MPDLEVPQLDPDLGTRLSVSDYRADFREVRAGVEGRDSWKLERAQHFEETRDGSRQALREGDWERALALLEEDRENLARMAAEDERKRSFFHRVRIVEEPLSFYVQWELHALRLAAEQGGRVRVVTEPRVRRFEAEGPLPELVVLGGRVLYRVCYTPEGVPDGGVRFTEPGVVAAWEGFIRRLYEQGEDVTAYFAREVAPLPAPTLPLGGPAHHPA
ncbi:hypothetical protein RM844_31025 [Streptomyces sp. DSM 44915]|uniref:DUF6879 domain-containing protein n=1 Tax=Streptomyces chisholmiae TaxID=3075540 RepID=A0ABU2K0V9_9ACTN|nr:DUF6879 family protein [Streptomyces sp. DSM 44915]MDT0270712.1 hypothetical protein [Streptomyces sp. DSM 44915]